MTSIWLTRMTELKVRKRRPARLGVGPGSRSADRHPGCAEECFVRGQVVIGRPGEFFFSYSWLNKREKIAED